MRLQQLMSSWYDSRRVFYRVEAPLVKVLTRILLGVERVDGLNVNCV